MTDSAPPAAIGRSGPRESGENQAVASDLLPGATAATAAVPHHSGRIAALDGIRAVALAAVLLYHAGIGWAQGGFLGVDVFFVLSGYLITGLLAGEYLRAGRISLRRFYFHRARRLLPALFTVIATVCVVVVLWLPQSAPSLRGDATASLGYVTNWWFIGQGQSYFGGLLRPSLLLHLWSLAVEEQFYVLWPLMLILMLRGAASGGRIAALWRALGWSVILAGVSAGVMAHLYSPWKDPSRVYYGTDTRAFELLIGAALSLAVTVRAAERDAAGRSRSTGSAWAGLNDAAAGSALASIVLACIVFRTNTPAVYPWGLIVLCVVAAVLVQTVVNGGFVASLLGTRPMVWLGERSYAFYLWHWPVFDLTRPAADVTWPGWVIFTVRIGVSLVLAEATYRWIEQPIRGGALGRIAGRTRAALRERRPALPVSVAASVLAGVVAVVVLATAVNITADRHPSSVEGLFAGSAANPAPVTEPTSAGSAGSGPQAADTSNASKQRFTVPVPDNFPALPANFPAPPAKPLKVQLIGDSQGVTLKWSVTPDFSRYIDVSAGATLGCGLLLGRVTSTSGGFQNLSKDCASTLDDWQKVVNLVHPDVVVFVTGGWEVYDDAVDGKSLVFGTPAWDDYYRLRLAMAVAKIRATGTRQIDLALLPCWTPVAAMMPGFAAERGIRSRTDHVNTLLAAYAKTAGDGVGILTPPAQFCTDPSIGSNTAYRIDGVHYQRPGALLYYQTIIPQLFAVKP